MRSASRSRPVPTVIRFRTEPEIEARAARRGDARWTWGFVPLALFSAGIIYLFGKAILTFARAVLA